MPGGCTRKHATVRVPLAAAGRRWLAGMAPDTPARSAKADSFACPSSISSSFPNFKVPPARRARATFRTAPLATLAGQRRGDTPFGTHPRARSRIRSAPPQRTAAMQSGARSGRTGRSGAAGHYVTPHVREAATLPVRDISTAPRHGQHGQHGHDAVSEWALNARGEGRGGGGTHLRCAVPK